MSEQESRTEEFTLRGEAVIAKIKELVHEGNIRRITIKDESGQTLIEIPLTLGVVGVVSAADLLISEATSASTAAWSSSQSPLFRPSPSRRPSTAPHPPISRRPPRGPR